ncbi:MAG: NADH-quinone oxidoreductase subunit NuoG [Acidimicrobiales bacterium]
MADPIKINVDGKMIEATPGEMIISAAERGGTYIPRFCWHPRMRPVGMCRMCLVEVKGPRGFALMPACYVPVADGQEIVTDSPKVKKAQDGVLEFLLINHPLDCPVCDRGGECPLQDQTFAFGPGESRFVEEKRHWAKPIPINPLVALDRERCIQCSRCTRFADEVAGDAMIDFIGRSDSTEVNIFADRPFTSNFSGNVVQICPVGALTATPYRFKARPWDLDVVESTCTACSVGCRMALQSSSDRLIRHLGVDSDPVNHGWLCDKGRFAYEQTDNPDRLRTPLVRRDGQLVEASWNEAMVAAAEGLHRAGNSVAMLGGARLPNEDAYAWAKLAKGVLRTDNVDCQMGDGLPAELVLGLPRATIDEACAASAVVLLAPDLKEDLPVFYLRLREAAVDGNLKLIEIAPHGTGLSRHAEVRLQYRPGEAPALVRALAAERVPSEGAAGVSAADIGAAAEVLGAAESVVVVVGRASLAESGESIADAAGVLAAAMPDATFLPALRRGNVHGALDMGLAPGLLPGRVSLDDGRAWFADAWGQVPAARGLDAGGILAAAAEGKVQALVLVGADPVSDFPDRALALKAMENAGFTVVVDLFGDNASHAEADVVLPAAGFGERPGTTTNMEGRVSRLGQMVTPPGTARPDWMIAADLAHRLGADLGFQTLDDIAGEIERLAPAHAGLTPQLLSRPGYRDGVVVPLADPTPTEPDLVPEGIEVAAAKAHAGAVVLENDPDADAPLDPGGAAGRPQASAPATARPPLIGYRPATPARQAPPVDAYSLRLVAVRALYDAGALVSRSPSLAALAQAPCLRANPADLGRMGVKTGDRVRVTSSRKSLILDVAADPLVLRGSAVLAFNAPGEGAADLIDVTQPVTDLRVETVGAGGRDREAK